MSMPTPWERCNCFPSVWSDGASMISAFWNSFRSRSRTWPSTSEGPRRGSGVRRLVRRSEQDLFQGAAYLGAHARTARQRRVKGGLPSGNLAPARRRCQRDPIITASARRRWPLAMSPPCSCRRRDHVHVHAGLIEVAHCAHRRTSAIAAAWEHRCRAPRATCRRCPVPRHEHTAAPVRMRCSAAW